MTVGTAVLEKWKTPADLLSWLDKRFERLVAAALGDPGASIERFRITAPGLTAEMIAEHFAAVRGWAGCWQEAAAGEADLEVVFSERRTQKFGRVRIPKGAHILSIDCAARLLRRTRDLACARQRYDAMMATDRRLTALAAHWVRIIAMSESDFAVLCRFVTSASTLDLAHLRLREVPCAGMHTKFLEANRAILKPILEAIEVPPNPCARTWAGRLGLLEDDTRMFEIRDLDGGLLPYRHVALPAGQLIGDSPVRSAGRQEVRGVVVAENQATFQALPPLQGIVEIFGQGFSVRTLGSAAWLAARPLLYLGDLDHAGFQIVAGLRRDGLTHLRTALMDEATAAANRAFWVNDMSTPGANQAYEGLTGGEIAAQRLMAAGPWRLEQERIPFDQLIASLVQWHPPEHQKGNGVPSSGRSDWPSGTAP